MIAGAARPAPIRRRAPERRRIVVRAPVDLALVAVRLRFDVGLVARLAARALDPRGAGYVQRTAANGPAPAGEE